MSQQGGRPARHEDDWWGELYDDSPQDTGPTAAPDSLDDRYASARSAVAGRPADTRPADIPEPPPAEPAPPEPAPPDSSASPPAPAPARAAVPPQRTAPLPRYAA
ncbi:hypothetical protein QR97_39335 [Streptomyces sp. PBH53]|uniref:hypothetical protein n=1 Tax=Streptomyces sp. PBH53 TaxID=1577075 RepID=UPI000655A5A0|nr:hypothetical protein [Streptomyces sp. PBH53]AKN74946.1 hypothetical protein QR97_39335 [Streptomyces sp. PBH53]